MNVERKYSKKAFDNSRELKLNSTEAEKYLWSKLKTKRFDNLKFRRQQAIGNYIVDFVCFEKKFVVELDGGQHGEDKVAEYDEKRTKFLNSLGYKVIRFWDSDLFKNVNGVLNTIYEEIMC